MKKLEEVFSKQKKKDVCASIRTTIGKILSNEKEFLSSIENLNDENKLNSLIEQFCEDCEYIINYTGDINELKSIIKYEFTSAIPRKYCILKHDLDGSKLFVNIKDLLKTCPELEEYNYITNGPLYLGFKKETSKKGKRILEEYKKNKKFEMNDKPAESFTTKEMTTIDDFSPVLFDFLLQKEKHIYKFDDGTGYGKSHSINVLASKIVRNTYLSDYINHIIYITDRKNNVKQEFDDFIDKNQDLEDCSLLLLSNTDCIIENFNVFEQFPDTLKDEYGYYKKIEKWVKSYIKTNKQDTDIKSMIDELEPKYRKTLKSKFDKIFSDNNIINYDEKIDFLQNSEDYHYILDVYKSILIKNKQIIFVNNDKAYLPIDIIIEKRPIYFNQSKELLKNSVIIMDESDAAADKFLEKICEESLNTQIDLLEKTIMLHDGFTRKKLGAEYNTEEIKKMINEVNELFDELESKFFIHYNISFGDINLKEDRWLFVKNNKEFVHTNNSENNYIMKYDEEQDKVFLNKKTEENNELPSYNDFIESLTKIYRQYQRVIKKMANIEIKKDSSCEINQLLAIQRVLTNLNISKDQNSRQGLIRDISMISKEEYDNPQTEDFYLNPGSIVRTILDDDEPENIKINFYNLQSTPENYLKQLNDCGAYVILSSATGSNKSKFKNFNTDWKYLKNEIYEPDNHAKKLCSDYRKEREKNADKVSLEILQCPQKEVADSKELVDLIIGYFKNESKEEINSLINELNNIIKTNRNKEDIEYAFCEYLKSILDCLYKLQKGSLLNLILLRPNLQENELPIISKILKTYNCNCEIFSAKSETMENVLEDIKKEISNDKLCFLYTTYGAAEKGYNFKMKISKNKYSSSLIAVNDAGVTELKEKDFVDIDLTGIYLGSITYATPSINKNTPREYMMSVLKSIYYACSLFYEFNKKETILIEKILNNSYTSNDFCYPFYSNDYSNFMKSKIIESECANILACVQQAIGRGGRCNVRLANKYITINDNIISKLKKYPIKNLISNDVLEKQSYEVRKTIEFIDNIINSNDNFLNKEGIINDSNKIYFKALEENNLGNPNKLKFLQNNLTRLFITEEEYKLLDPDIKKFYIKNERFLKNGYSYEFSDEDDYGNKKVTNLYHLNKKPNKVSFKVLNLSDSQIEILNKNGIRIDKVGYENGYIMLPRAFDTLLGNIGEILAKEYFDKYIGCYLEELPDVIYEKMDYIKEYDKFVLSVDAKYYVIHSQEYDNREELMNKFSEKTNKIHEYYSKKVVSVIFNTRDNNANEFKTMEYLLESGDRIITVPNIFTDGKINIKILDSLNDKIFKED